MLRTWLRFQRRLEEALLAYGILAIAVLMIANVFSRRFLGFSLTFGEELSQFLIILVCFVGLSFAVSQRRHIRMTAFLERMGEAAQRRVEVLIASTCALMHAALLVWSLRYVWIVADLGSVSPVLQVPLYLVYLVAPLGFFLCVVRYATQTRRWLRGEEVLEPVEGAETLGSTGEGEGGSVGAAS